MKNNTNKGFTLIELLVVIAIIGILAGIILVSLNTARGKANDAAVKSNLAGVRTAMEVYYGDQTPNGYGSASNCTTGPFASGQDANKYVNNLPGGALAACGASASAYAVSASLPSTNPTTYWCVDSSGYNASIASQITNGDTTCQ